jgi:hypothetical protein
VRHYGKGVVTFFSTLPARLQDRITIKIVLFRNRTNLRSIGKILLIWLGFQGGFSVSPWLEQYYCNGIKILVFYEKLWR